MDKWKSMSLNQSLFDLASRLGSLEGYLFSEEKVEKNYLSGWLQNIDREFGDLPAEVKREIEGAYLELLNKVQALLRRIYGDDDSDTQKVKEVINKVRRG